MRDMLKHTKNRLKADEGLRLHPYRDTVGRCTIGYGHNLTDNGVPQEIAERLLDHDISEAVRVASAYIGFDELRGMDAVRQSVLINMAFNLGYRLHSFRQLKKAILAEDFSLAATEMLDSKWARQVKSRARRLAKEMRSGVYI